MRVLFVDDAEHEARALISVLEARVPDVESEWCPFDEVVTRDDLLTFDYIAVDLSHPRKDNPLADEFPGVQVVAQVAAMRDLRVGPFLVVTTGESGPFGRDAVRLRLKEARCEVFVHRSEFTDQCDAIFAPGGPTAARLEVPEAAKELGRGARIGRRAQLNRFVRRFPTREVASPTKVSSKVLVAELDGMENELDVERPPGRRYSMGRAFFRNAYQNLARISPRTDSDR